MRVLALLILLAIPGLVHAQTGRGVRPEVDLTGAPVAVLVSKDVNGQRWSIRLGLDGDTAGRVTGIISDPANPSADPVFAECFLIDVTGGPDVDSTNFVFDCTVGPTCPSRTPGSCQAWQDVGVQSIPVSFFLPAP